MFLIQEPMFSKNYSLINLHIKHTFYGLFLALPLKWTLSYFEDFSLVGKVKQHLSFYGSEKTQN